MREFKSCHLGHLIHLLQKSKVCTYIVEKSWGLQPIYILLYITLEFLSSYLSCLLSPSSHLHSTKQPLETLNTVRVIHR